MALSDHTLIAAYPLGFGIEDLQDSYDGYSAQNMTFAGDVELGGLPVADFNSSYYGIDNALENGLDTEYSISMWIKPDSLPAGSAQRTIMANEQHGSYYNTFGIQQMSDGQLYIHHRSANGGAYDIAFTGVSLAVDEWYHVTATWSGTQIKWYVDGELTSTTAATRVPWNSPATLWIGANATKTNKTYYDGKMSDLRFWYSELTASDISELYAAGQVPIDLGLVLHHDCDDATAEIGSDVTFTDVSIGSSLGRTHWDFANLNSKAPLDVNNLPDMSGDWTVSMWFSEMTAPTTWRSIAKSQTEILGVVSSPHHSPANTLGVYTTTGYVSAGYSMNYLNFQNWNHMVIVGSGTTTKFYINGSHVGTAPVKISTDLYSINNQPVGAYNQLFANNMDDLRAWNRALSEIEVQALHLTTTVTPSLTDDLVAKYALDTDASDSVGSNDGTVTGVDFISDSGRTVASFDASAGEKIHFGDVDDVDFGTADFSVGAWVNFNSISTGPFVSPVVQKGQTSLANWSGYALNAYQGQMRFGVGGNNGVKVAAAAITTGDWHHVVGTRKGAAIKLYIDGSLVDTQADTMTRNVSTHLPLTFGSINNGTEYNGLLDAMVDDVRVWSRALSDSEVSTLHAAGADSPAPSGYDWTHGGNLSDIVKFSRGYDISGNPSYAYAKKESGDGSTTLYFATDFQTWSTFSSYASGVSSIDGSPICMEYGPNGKVLVGTDSGKLYEIVLDGSSAPQSYSLVHSMAGSEDIKVIKYGVSSNLWAFEAGGKVYTIPVGGGAAVEKLDLNVVDQAGSIVQDMSEANDAWSIVVRRSDFTFVVYLVSPDWSTVNNPASLQAVLSAINPVDLNYFYDIDTWCASGADGTVITTDDINNWIV